MTDFKTQSATTHVTRHLFLTVSSLIAALLLSAATADSQSAGPQTAKLIGTIQSDGFVGAVISDAKGEQIFYRLKEKLPDGSQIVKVRQDSILLKGADGTSYEIFVSHETTAAAASPTNPAASANPNTPEAMRNALRERSPETLQNAPRERPPSSYEKRHGKRKSDLDNQ